jgi:mycothiol synthase
LRCVADVEVRESLTPAEVADVRRLLDAATEADGVYPLSEHVYLHLTHGDAGASNLLLREGSDVVGYAHVDRDPVEGVSAELVVAPGFRARGHGRQLVDRVLALAGGDRVRLWAHGDNPAAGALARSLGFERQRVLWQMRRSLHAPLPAPSLPDDVSVRTFRVGEDEERWIAVNNRAFAHHPDQGQFTVADLRMREEEAWFDPAGFFLAFRGEDLVAFHWTKVHGADGHGHDAIGEVYVVGVDPSAQGAGLGPAMTLVGLRHLRSRGLASVMLYVDEVNTNAIRVYERLGFTRWDADICYQRA